jgi:cell division protein ZapA
MAVVNVMVNGRAYTIACDDGEEDHLRDLAAHVDGRVKELLSSVGQVGDSRLLLMAALLITDDYFDAQNKLTAHREQVGELNGAHDELHERLEQSELFAAEALENAAKRMEDMAAKLGHA